MAAKKISLATALEAAREAARNGNLDQAIKLYKAILSHDSSHLEAKTFLSDHLKETGGPFSRAIESIKKLYLKETLKAVSKDAKKARCLSRFNQCEQPSRVSVQRARESRKLYRFIQKSFLITTLNLRYSLTGNAYEASGNSSSLYRTTILRYSLIHAFTPR